MDAGARARQVRLAGSRASARLRLGYAARVSISIVASVEPTSNRVEARTERGHSIIMAGDPPEGEGDAAGPKETLLIALAGCTSMDVASLLRKKRQTAASYEIAVRGDSAAEHPQVFISIDVEHRVRGEVTPEALRRSIELSATRYCPVSAMLSAVATIEHRYRLTDITGTDHQALVAVTGPTGSRVL
jgi:putative redox protein